MGCGSCGTGKPNGCKSNGGCSTGGCNRLNVHDWLANLPFADPESACKVVEVSFNNGSRKDFFRNPSLQYFEKGELVSVEGVSGFDVGEVNLTGEMVRLQLKKKGGDEFNPEMKKILRRAGDRDIDIWKQNKAREREALIRSRAICKQLKLNMKLSEVEIQADGRKATFFYIADDRVDFRELIRVFASEFKVKVEMRQIGARQEAAKVGGIGSCGRELCCSTWLSDFKSVNTTAARYQNLSINQTKLSGQCGRLKCCLNYELDTYLDALQHFPDNADTLQVARGNAFLVKKDIFRNLMWFTLPDSNKQYPVTIERVRKIKQLNQQGVIPEELEAVDITTNKPKESESGFVELVGQISLNTLEKADRRNRPQGGGRGNNQRGQQPQARQGGTINPNQQRQAGGNNNPPQQRERSNQPPRDNSNPPQQARGGNNTPPPQRRPGGTAPQQRGPGNTPQRPTGNRPPQNNGAQPPPTGDNPNRERPKPPIKKKPE
jgi:cell fate regulator YaaT (PSP1 superfamily)